MTPTPFSIRRSVPNGIEKPRTRSRIRRACSGGARSGEPAEGPACINRNRVQPNLAHLAVFIGSAGITVSKASSGMVRVSPAAVVKVRRSPRGRIRLPRL